MSSPFVAAEAAEASTPISFVPESPFLETPGMPAETEATQFEGPLLGMESPFLRDVYETEAAAAPLAAEFAGLVSEMYEASFNETVQQLASEALAAQADRLNGGVVEREGPESAERLLTEHFDPLARAAETLVDQFAQTLGRYDIASLTEAEIDRVAEQFEPGSAEASPVFEQFLRGLRRKLGKFAKGALNLAKRGLAAVGKLGLGPILAKLRGLVWPLIKRVIRFALNRVPASVRPLARKLASMLGREAAEEAFAAEPEFALQAAPSSDYIQLEFDAQAAQLLFAADEVEMEAFLAEGAGAAEQYFDPAGDMHRAREQLIGELERLAPGQDAAPAIQNFLPAALLALRPIAGTAINLIGRKSVVDAIARMLAPLIGRFLGPEGARTLARPLAGVGLRVLVGETAESEDTRFGNQVIAATLERTLENLVETPPQMFEHPQLLEAAVQQAFESAAVANFPTELLRPDLTEGHIVEGSWLPAPAHQRRKYYKKFIPKAPPLTVTITEAMASRIDVFQGGKLSDFFNDQLGISLKKPLTTRMHIYEAICGTSLAHIGLMEKSVPGLGSSVRDAYFQIHPLTPEIAQVLIGPEHADMGKGVDAVYLVSPEVIRIGQRFYYLEVPRPTVRVPGSYVRVEIDFRRSEIRIYVYLNERAAQEIAQQLREKGAIAGALKTYTSMLRAFYETVKAGKVGDSVKVIREAPEPEMLPPSLGTIYQGARSAASSLANAVGSAVGSARAAAAGVASRVAGALPGGASAAAAPAAGGGGAKASAGGAIGGAILTWLLEQVLDFASGEFGKWLVENKEVFIRNANDPSKKGVTIVIIYSGTTVDLIRRALAGAAFQTGLAIAPSRVELYAGPR